jgi:hypothetical protein
VFFGHDSPIQGLVMKASDYRTRISTSWGAGIIAIGSFPPCVMCGILATSRDIEDIQEVIEFLKEVIALEEQRTF